MRFFFSLLLLGLGAALPFHVALAEHPSSPKKLTAIGSDSMGSMMRRWVEAYESQNAAVDLQVVSRGSATAPAALIDGNADLGPMSRPMKVSELDQFRSRYGFEPTQIRTALAAAAIYVSKDNPITQISFEQLDGIFSLERKRGAEPIRYWRQLGVKGALANQEIVPLGLEADNQTSSYFRQQVLLQGSFPDDMLATTDNRSLFQALRAHANGIAFGDVVENLQNVKLIPVSKDKSAAMLPTEDNISSSAYPLGRFLNIYIVRYPGEDLEPSLKSFLQFVLSPSGQSLVKSEGLIALPPEMLKAELSKLD